MTRLLTACLLLTGCSYAESGDMKARAVYPMTATATTKGVSAGPGYTAVGRVADQAGALTEIIAPRQGR